MIRTLLLVAMLAPCLGGCLASNFAEVVKAMGNDPNPHCLVLNAPMYGSLATGKGSPEVNVAITPGSCIMNGNNVTDVKVPVGTLGVTPLVAPARRLELPPLVPQPACPNGCEPAK
jgi:hypothetical protein